MSFSGMLFAAWVLSIPFYHFSLVGSLSLDNIIAPILFVYLVLQISMQSQSLTKKQIRNLMFTLVTVLVYLISHTINLLTTESLVWSSIVTVAKSMLFFLLPVLFVRTEKDMRYAGNLIVLVMFFGSASALMSALGIVNFEFARQAESRINLDVLPKSVGLFTSFGDMALLISISIMLAIYGMKTKVFFPKGSFLVVLTFSVMGMISMQSRNMAFTILVSVAAYYVIGRWRKKHALKMKLYSSLVAGIIFAVFVLLVFGGPLLEWVEGLGGTNEAKATVEDRLQQYMFAWSLVENRILFGADSNLYEKYELIISFIHNMWLKELVRTGLFGIIAILWIYLRALNRQVDIYNNNQLSVSRCYIGMLIGLLVVTQFYPADTQIFWLLLGLATAMPTNARQPAEEVVKASPVQKNRILSFRKTHLS
jgi:O-antigen ligase